MGVLGLVQHGNGKRIARSCSFVLSRSRLIPFLLVHTVFAWWQLTSANYVEHYGLLRQRDEHGKIEHCEPHHSWNSNHIFSNLVLFHLERHSDHHAHPLRRYQSLRHYPDLPRLPNGYFGVYLLAYVPVVISPGDLDLVGALTFIGLWVLVAYTTHQAGLLHLLNLATAVIGIRILIVYFEVFGSVLQGRQAERVLGRHHAGG